MLQLAPERIRKLAVDAIKKNGYTIDYEWIRFVDKSNYRVYAVNVCSNMFADCGEDELAITLCDVDVYGDKEHVRESQYNQFTIHMSEVA